MNREPIHNRDLAEIMAYTEAPYYDQILASGSRGINPAMEQAILQVADKKSYQAAQCYLENLVGSLVQHNPAETTAYDTCATFSSADIDIARACGEEMTRADLDSFTRSAYPDVTERAVLFRTGRVWKRLAYLHSHQANPGTLDIFTPVKNVRLAYIEPPDDSSRESSGSFDLASVIGFIKEYDEWHYGRVRGFDLLGRGGGEIAENLLRHYVQDKLIKLRQENPA